MAALSAQELTSPYVLDGIDGSALTHDLANWALRTLHPAIPSVPEGLGASHQLFIQRANGANQAYVTTLGNIPIPLAGNRGAVYHGIALPRQGNGLEYPHEDAQQVAIKVVDINIALWILAQGIPENPWKEIVRLIFLQQTGFVPRFFDAFTDGTCLFLVTEWASDGNLADLAKAHGGFIPLNILQELVKQFFQILTVLHGQYSLCHRDIKPQNLLWHNGQLLLTDWAQSFVMPSDGLVQTHLRHGTPGFMLPESFHGQLYSGRQYDLWAFGATMYSLIMGVPTMYRVPTTECIFYEYIIAFGSVSRNPLTNQVLQVWNQFEININGVIEALMTASIDSAPGLSLKLDVLQRTLSILKDITASLLALPNEVLEVLENIFYPIDRQNPLMPEVFLQMPWFTAT